MTTRIRSRGVLTPAPYPYEERIRTSCSETAYVFNANLTGGMVGEIQTMTDEVIPGFHKRRSVGELFFNDMSMEKTSVSLGSASGWVIDSLNNSCSNPILKAQWRTVNSLLPSFILGNIAPGSHRELPRTTSIFSEYEKQAIVTEATTRCLADRGKSDNNLFESLAEFKKTAHMLSAPIGRLYGLLRHASKAKEAMKIAKEYNPAALWLQYRYGILPLLRDIAGILDGVKGAVGNTRSTTRASVNDSRSVFTTAYSTLGIVRGLLSKTVNESITVRAMSLDEYVADTASNVGFSTKGLLGLPWELLTYSFVLDWFANVGDFLYAVMPTPGFNQLGSCVVTKITRSTVWQLQSCENLNPGSYALTQSPTGTATILQVTKTRRALGKPGVVVKADFRLDNNVRLADSFSLLAQAFARAFK